MIKHSFLCFKVKMLGDFTKNKTLQVTLRLHHQDYEFTFCAK
jgi:predicted ferric reductase